MMCLPGAAQQFSEGDLNFEIEDGGACILIASPGVSGKVVVPETVTYENSDYNVTSIAASAFENNTAMTALQLPDGLRDIGVNAMKGCRALEVVGLPLSLTAVGAEAFAGCKALARIEIPDGTESIGRKAFYECSVLSTVILGKNVKRIDMQAFDGCDCISCLHISAPEPPAAGAYVFTTSVYDNAELTVPVGRRGAYMAASPWSRFKHIAERDAFGENVTLTLCLPSGCISTEETYGLPVTFELLPDKGWRVYSVSFNGTPLNTDDKRVTTSALTEDSRLEVVFADESGADLTAISDLKIRTEAGAILIEGVADTERVEVFSLSGKLLYSGFDHVIRLDFSGTVILKINKYFFKLSI